MSVTSGPTYNEKFEAYQGSDITINFVIYESNGVDPEDITSWTLGFYLQKQGQERRVDELTKTIGNGITITDAANGAGYVTIPRDESIEMDTLVWNFDLWRTNAGFQYPVSIGSFDLIETARSRGDD